MRLGKIVYLHFLILGLTLSMSAMAYKNFDESGLEECQNNQKFTEIKTVCNDLFHVYPSGVKTDLEDLTPVKVAGYNIYEIGSGESRYKDFAVNAKMVNQWDVIGAVEIKRVVGDDATNNEKVIKLLAKGERYKFNMELAKRLYKMPAYLKFLVELRKLDPSWSMIMTPYQQSKRNELTSIYYRSSKVQLESTKYCESVALANLITRKGIIKHFNGEEKTREPVLPTAEEGVPLNAGCILSLPLDQEELTARIPFAASFKSGNFDFTLLATHLRFRTPGLVAIHKMLDTVFHPEGLGMPILNSNLLDKIIKKKTDDTITFSEKERTLADINGTKYEVSEADITKALTFSLPLLKARRSYYVANWTINLPRYYETRFYVEQMQKMREAPHSICPITGAAIASEEEAQVEKDIILVGDFNLDIPFLTAVELKDPTIIKIMEENDKVTKYKTYKEFIIKKNWVASAKTYNVTPFLIERVVNTIKKLPFLSAAEYADPKVIKALQDNNKTLFPEKFKKFVASTSRQTLEKEYDLSADTISRIQSQLRQDDEIQGVDFWPIVLDKMPGSNIFLTKQTSLKLDESDERPDGLANSYDHYLLDLTNTKECKKSENGVDTVNAQPYSFVDDATYMDVNSPIHSLTEYLGLSADEIKTRVESYMKIYGEKEVVSRLAKVDDHSEWVETVASVTWVKDEKPKKEAYTALVDAYKALIDANSKLEKKLKLKKMAIEMKLVVSHKVTRKAVKKMIFQLDKDAHMKKIQTEFQARVYESQSTKDIFKVFKEVVSDHVPVFMECGTASDDD